MSNDKLKAIIELLKATLTDDMGPATADTIVQVAIKLLEEEANT